MPSKSNILVIDDNTDITNIIKISLEKDGHVVDTFNDPFLALKYFKSDSNRSDLVISDVRMPGMSGLELVARIKRINPEVKVIFMTAFEINNINLELEKFDYEIAEIFQKPIFMRNLRKMAKELLTNSSTNIKSKN
jgi:DNA-binding NtrC family response regulator